MRRGPIVHMRREPTTLPGTLMSAHKRIPRYPRIRLPEKEVNLAIGARLRKARLARGMTQTDISAALGVSYQQVQRYEQGVVNISPGKLKALAGIVDVPITYFFGEPKSGENDSILFDARLMLLMRRLPVIQRHRPDLFMEIYKMVATPRTTSRKR